MKGLSHYNKDFIFVGIDLAKAMINFGKEKVANKKISFLKMSAGNIKFNDLSFDLILAKDVFHHFKNPIKVLKEMYRVLKKGGEIYAIDLRRDVPEEIFYQSVQWASELNIENAILYKDSVQASYTIPEMKKILKRVGIKKYKIFEPKINKNFLKDYNIKSKDYLSASNYLRDKWILVVKK